ncbi:MAG: ImmA/IrrE family metallo-endopeptidase [Magnetococcales bacterium]|nr:ImmA/IrrE family metallo-endopeptidase [Magnetococcales bacterium]
MRPIKADYLPKGDIERATQQLLGQYQQRFPLHDDRPIPVEEILESQGLTLELEDIRASHGAGVLGYLSVQQRLVVVDYTLDPTEDPGQEGRYRFTIGHELGHWWLHRHLIDRSIAGQLSLFDEVESPDFICRSGDIDPVEWQANQFAAFLLMPTERVKSAWIALHGTLVPYLAAEEMAEQRASSRWYGRSDKPPVALARRLASQWAVSAQAMQLRLLDMGLVRDERPGDQLFY